MRSLRERERFSERLREALRKAHYPPDSPTQIAREFNIRYPGRPITAHAVRKWLRGEAIPTPEKLHVLAQWLSVPAAWLRSEQYARKSSRSPPLAPSELTLRFSPGDVKLISSIKDMDEHHRRMAAEIVAILALFGGFSAF